MAKLHPLSASRALLLFLLAWSHQACQGAESMAADADREVYDIIQARRAELDVEGAFTVEPPAGTLRERVLSGETREIPPLRLVDALQIAAEGNRDYQSARESLYLEALDLTLERWDFSVQETGTLGAFLLGTGGDAGQTGGFGSLGFTKLFGSGLRIISDIGFDLARDLSSGNAWEATSNLSLNITQPILRGFGRSIVEEPLTQAERDVLYEARSYESFRRDLAVDVASRYFLTLSLYDRLKNEEANTKRRTALRERNEAFSQAGKLNDIDVDQARQDELDANDRLVEARRGLEASLDNFKFFLGLPIDVQIELDLESRGEIEKWKGRGVDVTEERGTLLALERRYDYQTTLDRVVDAERGVKVAADGLRAGLDARIDGAATSEADKPLSYRGSDFDWTLSLDFDAPLDRLPERNLYRQAMIALQSSQRRAEEEADLLRSQVRSAIRDLDAARATFEIQNNAVTLAERRVESSELSLEAGRAETRDVLESQNALIQAQNQASLASTDFVLAILALYRTMECLSIDEDGIRLEDEVPVESVDKLEPVEQP